MSTIAISFHSDQAPLKLFVTICAWCGKELGRRWTVNGGVSDGICADCEVRVRAEHAAFKNLRRKPCLRTGRGKPADLSAIRGEGSP